ncbi:unnamed protein product [Peronospora belbahrii]|uniref:Histone deacetylase domain-containing protein n=1 Tax=Peronospora belbahrii TaxID=622444 RepID=A0ABN8CTI1_9STRA|nr:unnamed protein product [Peronospora belbahrii]
MVSRPSQLTILSCETSLLEKDDMGFLPLHVAIIHQQVDCVIHVLRYSSALTNAMIQLNGGDFNTPLIHLILRVGALNASFSEEIIKELFSEKKKKKEDNDDDDFDYYSDDVRALLLEKIAARDEEGNTVFHLCARYDLVMCLHILVTFYKRQFAAWELYEREQFDREDHEEKEDKKTTTKKTIKKKKPMKLETLLEKGNKVGFRPLHEAMKYRAVGAARKLVHEYNVDMNSMTSLHQTPAHIAALVDFTEGVKILRNSSRHVAAHFTIKDKHGRTPAQVARRCAFTTLEMQILAGEAGTYAEESAVHQEKVLERDQTRLFFHPEVWRHLPMTYHRRGGPDPPPENPERIDTLVDPVFGILQSREFQQPNVKWDLEIKRADIADILRVHEFSYVNRIRQKCSSLAASVVGERHDNLENDGMDGTSHDQFLRPFDLTSASGADDTKECHSTLSLDSDTALSARSFDAATRAAGAVCKAVDEVVAGKCRNAFCIVRPPGHHAGPVGKVVCENDPEGSLGFCLFNNVAIGAAYARAHLKHCGIDRVAILDFDVHHGNGTEEIVRQLVPSTKEITYETPYGVGKQVVHQYKPWRSDDDSENVFFCSVHGYGHKDPEHKEELVKGETQGWFYPGSGISNVKEAPLIWNEGLSFCREGTSASRLTWRSAFRDRILPKLRDFNPDLIFLSAGFDAHKKELVNWGYVSLLEQDYEWLVRHIKQVANTCCNGRLISVLEGGYNFHGRMVSPFARSVAAHTRALINPAQERWDEEEIAKEATHEQTLLANYLAPAASSSVVTVLQTKKRTKDAASLLHSRDKRIRKEVDYVALAKELSEQR